MTTTTEAETPKARTLDLEPMQTSARRLLAEDAELPSIDELDTLTLRLRGHIMLIIPGVETAAFEQPDDDVPRACALACIGEARMRLRLEADPGLPAGIAHAQRLARSLDSLCDHYVNLHCGPEEGAS
ncbi:DUF6415 family natural product biosynthesis protein [Streptomyces phaeochromogenes]|uniref:DUF6415 family natural product biosynthesis protein n=1 Tax=Streptomyces phaeochromogenes TaxID=1923 RepID=UPI002DD7B286|nr:DUF6415 family natural product biosynthesis protein [Streptomyces phaeochromogenes]WRZ30151.1 DUF6415 family natural product biosynthesis protein [Streptomyces phaeochromogenes]